MSLTVVEIFFFLSLIALYLIPRKSKRYKWIWLLSLLVFISNIGIRYYLIHLSHINSDKIDKLEFDLEKEKWKNKSRSISEVDKDKIIKNFKKYEEVKARVEICQPDSEIMQFGKQVNNIFKELNWKDDGMGVVHGCSWTGILISFSDNKFYQIGNDLVFLFRSMGLLANIGKPSIHENKKYSVILHIGSICSTLECEKLKLK